jgi:carbonic anhydrase
MRLTIRIAVVALAAAGTLGLSAAGAQTCSAVCPWGYGPGNGPPVWGTLCCPVCDGNSQSPIDIRSDAAVPAPELEPLAMVYRESHLEFFNTGKTLEAAYELNDGENYLEVGGLRYPLSQFHFHSLSEHTIDGRHAPIELHLVHIRNSYDIAVVAVLIEEGQSRPAVNMLWSTLPDSPKVERRTVILDPEKLLPKDRSYYTYRGSLTTPSCAETVTWYVLAQPILMESEQIERFRAIFAENYRPTQALNGRVVRFKGE